MSLFAHGKGGFLCLLTRKHSFIFNPSTHCLSKLSLSLSTNSITIHLHTFKFSLKFHQISSLSPYFLQFHSKSPSNLCFVSFFLSHSTHFLTQTFYLVSVWSIHSPQSWHPRRKQEPLKRRGLQIKNHNAYPDLADLNQYEKPR